MGMGTERYPQSQELTYHIPVGLDEAVQQGVKVMQGQTRVHSPVLLHSGDRLGLNIVILGPRKILCILPKKTKKY